jgi:hypothetical protein
MTYRHYLCCKGGFEAVENRIVDLNGLLERKKSVFTAVEESA